MGRGEIGVNAHGGATTSCPPGKPMNTATTLESESPLPIPKLEDVERVWVLYALQALNGNRREAALALGVSLKTVQNKVARYRREGYLP